MIEIKSIPGNSRMIHFAEINQALPLYSLLYPSGRVGISNLAPKICLRYLETTLRMVGWGWSQNLLKVLRVTWVFKYYELRLAGIAGFEKIKVGFSCVFWVFNTL